MKRQQWMFRAGELAQDGWETVVDDRLPGWEHTGLRVAGLSRGDAHVLPANGVERLIIPLQGGCTVERDGRTHALGGRASVFHGPTDVLYLGRDGTATVRGSGRVAVAEAPTTVAHPDRYISAGEIPLELRGSGRTSRQLHNFGAADFLEAGSFIVCEVITPAENWSSFPPHKHDELVPGVEVPLEEIYYFESATTRGVQAPAEADPFGIFACYGSGARDIEITAVVRSGDVALVPYGYHGPAAAVPGYDLYYLNVMAGPGPERKWQASDDPAHAWIRGVCERSPFDSRLPYGA